MPAYLQIGLCLFCASPAVNKDILGIIAIFKGRLYSSVLLWALPGLDPVWGGFVRTALTVGRGCSPGGAVLAGSPSPSLRPPHLWVVSARPWPLALFPWEDTEMLLSRARRDGFRSLPFPLLLHRCLGTRPLRLEILRILREPVLRSPKQPVASRLDNQNGARGMRPKRTIVHPIFPEGCILLTCSSLDFISWEKWRKF